MNALLALLIVGAAIWGVNLVRDTSSGNGANATGVRTVTVSQGTVTRSVTADGAVESAATAAATFATPGTVTAIDVKVGDRVAKGRLLARIDAAPAQRDLALARADLDAAEDALARAQAAGTDPTIAQNEVTSARLAVADAQAAVAGTRLTAPMAGTVTAINGSLGGSSSPAGSAPSPATPSGGAGGSAATTASGGFIDLADLSRLQIGAAFAEDDATALKPGQSATIIFNALDGAETTGRVVAVDPTATTTGGVVTYGVTVSLPAPPDGARPGQTVSVSVVTGSVDNAVKVNPAAVVVSGRRSTVTVLTAAGQPETRPVQVGLEGDDAYQITAGLTAGERVVIPVGAGPGPGSRGGAGSGAGGNLRDGGAPPGGQGGR
ncbi:macrolide-specific efflux system membrane fusion protein [Actinoplanes teichomyceticus]|uniref:Macrolide-specific efflux system membrane fusion protein n=1 Tax=Actinoplanes teichomyceticus TaxID=1867 RepID=A0A561WKJ3_ACTTI|nr:macrolide-specific efflux system membrane fusion protein [Actinoplanes teichomyceticus]GIF12761.1 RND transporter [Actinoplanes teichomyceticus]